MPKVEVEPERPASAAEVEAFTRALIEELTRLGYTRELILSMFKTPAFRATYSVYCSHGEAFVQGVLGQVFEARRAGRRTA